MIPIRVSLTMPLLDPPLGPSLAGASITAQVEAPGWDDAITGGYYSQLQVISGVLAGADPSVLQDLATPPHNYLILPATDAPENSRAGSYTVTISAPNLPLLRVPGVVVPASSPGGMADLGQLLATAGPAPPSLPLYTLLSVFNAAFSSAIPQVEAGTGAAGTAPKLSRDDHVHPAFGGGGGMTNPMTAQGDLIVGGIGGAPQRKAIGTLGQFLTVAFGVLQWGDDGTVRANDPSAGGAPDNLRNVFSNLWTAITGKAAITDQAVAVSATANGDAYYTSPIAQTLGVAVQHGTGTVTLEKALNATPTTFVAASVPVTLAVGDVLHFNFSAVAGWKSYTLQRTA